ncbi:YbdD/YjiX family protein [Candidatus Nitrotoga sp. HW29]|uniref:YbdD/YjiX family protein n=1 Tax=Candidatus Nitrotoga sp. HW29 TaxID=2886963 RepID=UPI002A4E1579|nr:YbdD/YjiX family protein [Candidatus Nitrotoga sp. HW29]
MIKRSTNGLLSAVNNPSLPILETTRDVDMHITQSSTPRTNEICIKLLPLWSYIWHAIRELSGDDAYERYIAQHVINYPNTPPLARKDFFLYRQQQKWNGIQRCC